jgi:regulatory protein
MTEKVQEKGIYWLKIKAYCDRAERCHQDVQQKLMRWEVPHFLAQGWISELIAENLLNEERYARAYVHDHVSFRQWGASKIKQGLRRKGISKPLIDVVLRDLPAEDEEEQALVAGKRKWNQLKTKGPVKVQRMKLMRHLYGKGFSMDIMERVIPTIVQETDE